MGRLWYTVLVILPCFFSSKSFHQLCYTPLFWVNSHLESCFSFISWPILLADESDEECEVTEEMKDEGAGSCAELDGGGGPASIALGGGVGAVL